MTSYKHCKNRAEVAGRQEPTMSSHLSYWGTQFWRKSFFHQKEQTLFTWTAGIWNSLHYSSHQWVSYYCTRGSKGTAAAWLQHEAIPLLSRKADTWALPPLPFAKWINLSSVLLASIHLSIFIMLFQYSVICKTSSLLSSLMKLVNRSDASTQGQTGKWTANTIMSAKTSSSERATSSKKLLATD